MHKQSFRLIHLVWFLLVVGCSTIGVSIMESQFGDKDFSSREVSTLTPTQVDYWQDVKPVLEKRCVVCHGCYDAPCQLKLSSIEGIERGANSEKIYDLRLKTGDLTRLHVDATSVIEWQNKGFHSVLNEYGRSEEANRTAGVMYQLLKMKRDNPLPVGQKLSPRFDLSLENANACPSSLTVGPYKENTPTWGMPYGLPGLADADYTTLTTWLEQGALHLPAPDRTGPYQSEMKKWEDFLNQDGLKHQLFSRYFYEHVFQMHLYFKDIDHKMYFNLARSKTPPGVPIELISTRRPFDDPKVERVYYRFQIVKDTILAKAHTPYRIDDDRMSRLTDLFLAPEYEVTRLPSYSLDVATNPFIAFDEIPVNSRYRFLLDDAQLFIMGFIKGPVCRGQVALNVIADRFWVFFIDPDTMENLDTNDFLHAQSINLNMPAAKETSVYRPLATWLTYAEKQKAYLESRSIFLKDNAEKLPPLSTETFWNGRDDQGRVNDNTTLTIMRHFDSATVEKGLLGQDPKTSWVIDYPLLERIHYLLVAGYDVYGNAEHQLLTRVYMDFLRMEGERNFLSFLPKIEREQLRDFWYRGARQDVIDYMSWPSPVKTNMKFETSDEQAEFYQKMKLYLKDSLPIQHNLADYRNIEIAQEFSKLDGINGPATLLMPQVSLIRITDGEEEHLFTILRDNDHLNLANLLMWEDQVRDPKHDRLAVLPGVVGTYPNSLYHMDVKDVSRFVIQFKKMENEDDFIEMRNIFGIKRMDPDFWVNSDQLMAQFIRSDSLHSGLLDYSRLENR